MSTGTTRERRRDVTAELTERRTVRLDAERARQLDALVERGEFHSASAALRTALDRLLAEREVSQP